MNAPRPTHAAPLGDVYRRAHLWQPITLWGAMITTMRQAPSHTALVDGTHHFTVAELVRRAERVSAGLAARGLGPGDVVAVQLPNWHETIIAYLALARLGAIANPILPIYRHREVGFMLRQSSARACIIPGRLRDCDHRALLDDLRGSLPALAHTIVVRDDPGDQAMAWGDLVGTAAEPPPPATDATAIGLLLYTSGTTADPKGVLHSHETLLAEARSLGPAHGLGAGDIVLMPSPLTHISGHMHAFVVPAALGTTAVLMDRWDPAHALDLIATERVTYMAGAPTFLRDLAHHPDLERHDVRSLRLFSCGGADVDPALVRTAAARLGCVAKRAYGSSEFPTITTTCPGDPPERRITTEGRPIGAVEIRLVDDDGAPVDVGMEGEILARGPDCFLGYLDGALNADAFTPDGWFRTGDLGVLDAEGYLRIAGRKKDIIIRKGENISAREIEDLLAAHPQIAEVAVIGIPDADAGEIACAVIRLATTVTPALADLTAFLTGEGLSRRKLPERLEVVEDFPRSGSGKIVKRTLRDQLRRG